MMQQEPTIEIIDINVSSKIAYEQFAQASDWLTSIKDVIEAFFDVDDKLIWTVNSKGAR